MDFSSLRQFTQNWSNQMIEIILFELDVNQCSLWAKQFKLNSQLLLKVSGEWNTNYSDVSSYTIENVGCKGCRHIVPWIYWKLIIQYDKRLPGLCYWSCHCTWFNFCQQTYLNFTYFPKTSLICIPNFRPFPPRWHKNEKYNLLTAY